MMVWNVDEDSAMSRIVVCADIGGDVPVLAVIESQSEMWLMGKVSLSGLVVYKNCKPIPKKETVPFERDDYIENRITHLLTNVGSMVVITSASPSYINIGAVGQNYTYDSVTGSFRQLDGSPLTKEVEGEL